MKQSGEILARLRTVRSLRFESRSGNATGWEGIGTGRVAVTEPTPSVVVFTEAGKWQPASGTRKIGFSNVFRWSTIGEVLRLEHLRFGPESPVFLFDMEFDGQGDWREVSPHICQDDCYAASLAIRDSQIIVAWSVNGPQKRESILYTYW